MAFKAGDVIEWRVEVIAAGQIRYNQQDALVIHGRINGQPVLIYASGKVSSADDLLLAEDIVITTPDLTPEELDDPDVLKKVESAWRDLKYNSIIQP
jgi:hypothetical protein